MNIKSVTATISFDAVERALGIALAASDDLGAFNRVEIESTDLEKKEFIIRLSRKGRRGSRNSSNTENIDQEPEEGIDNTNEDVATSGIKD
jgi:hypothetical protein